MNQRLHNWFLYVVWCSVCRSLRTPLHECLGVDPGVDPIERQLVGLQTSVSAQSAHKNLTELTLKSGEFKPLKLASQRQPVHYLSVWCTGRRRTLLKWSKYRMVTVSQATARISRLNFPFLPYNSQAICFSYTTYFAHTICFMCTNQVYKKMINRCFTKTKT